MLALALVLVGSILYLPGLANRDLWNPNEPGYAEAAREMFSTGHWLYPITNGLPRGEKPAPYYWLIIGASFVTGDLDAAAARLPSAVFAILCLLLTFWIARRITTSRGALLSALILATSFRFSWQSRWAEPDIVLTFFVGLAMYFLHDSLRSENGRAVTSIGAYLAVVGAILIKGPVGGIVPVVTVLAYVATSGNSWRATSRGVISGWGIASAATILIIFLAILASTAGESYLDDLLIHQNLTRFVKAFDHREPFYFYIYTMLADFMPFSAFLLAAIVGEIRELRRTANSDVRFLLCWLLAGILFFSLSSSKREVYLLPLYPAAAITAGLNIEQWCEGKSEWWSGTLPAWLTTGVVILAALIAIVFVSEHSGLVGRFYAALESTGFSAAEATRLALPIVAIAASGSVLLALLLVMRYASLFSFSLVGLSATTLLYVQIAVLPAVNPYKSARVVGIRLQQLVPQGERFAGYAPGTGGPWVDRVFLWDSYLFYSDRQMVELPSAGSVTDYLRFGKHKVIVMKRDDFERLPPNAKHYASHIEEFHVGHKTILVVSNGP